MIIQFLTLLTLLKSTLILLHHQPVQAYEDHQPNIKVESSIRIAHCRSICRAKHTFGGIRCIGEDNYCLTCWTKCHTLGSIEEKSRSFKCNSIFEQEKLLNTTINPGIDTVCKFYVTRGVEEDKYKPSKLPAPGRQRAIRMKSNDVALIMYRNSESKWSEHTYLSGNDVSRLEMPAGAWIVIANEDGTLRQYSWEIWYPKLESLKKSYPLYQAHITWEHWQVQVGLQILHYQKYDPKSKIGAFEWKGKPSFVVTWQYEKGDGIMGNQVTNSESAYISLPSNSKYLVRITTNDSPGSYPIVVDTTIHTPKVMSCPEVKTFYGYSYRNSVYLIVFLFVLTICFLLKSVRDTCSKYYIKKNLINNPNKLAIIMEEGRK